MDIVQLLEGKEIIGVVEDFFKINFDMNSRGYEVLTKNPHNRFYLLLGRGQVFDDLVRDDYLLVITDGTSKYLVRADDVEGVEGGRGKSFSEAVKLIYEMNDREFSNEEKEEVKNLFGKTLTKSSANPLDFRAKVRTGDYVMLMNGEICMVFLNREAEVLNPLSLETEVHNNVLISRKGTIYQGFSSYRFGAVVEHEDEELLDIVGWSPSDRQRQDLSFEPKEWYGLGVRNSSKERKIKTLKEELEKLVGGEVILPKSAGETFLPYGLALEDL